MVVDKRLTPQEEEVMQIVWKLKGGFIKEFIEMMPSPKPPYTTIASTVKNLEKKKFVKSKQYANSYRYEPVIKRDEYKKHYAKDLVNQYFLNSYKDLVAFFAKEKKISSSELKEIIEMIEKHKSE